MRQDKFTYTQFPVYFDISVYDDARKWIINFFSSINDVLAVYEYGTVSSPGLSDLDLIVVLKDNPKPNIYKQLIFDNIPEEKSTLINNNCVKFISKRHFHNIKWLGSSTYKLIYGEKIELNDIPLEYVDLLKIIFVMDFLPERVLTLLKHRDSKIKSILDVIGWLKSYLISAKLTEDIIGKNIKEVNEFERGLKDLRKNWFHKNFSEQKEIFLYLIDKGIYSGLKIIKELSHFLIFSNYYMTIDDADEAIFYFNKENGFLFKNNCNEIYNNINQYYFYDKNKSLFFYVPSIWLNHFYFYGKCDGIISSKIQNNFILKNEIREIGIAPKLLKILSQRITLCNEMAAFLKKYAIPMNKLYRFGHIQHR